MAGKTSKASIAQTPEVVQLGELKLEAWREQHRMRVVVHSAEGMQEFHVSMLEWYSVDGVPFALAAASRHIAAVAEQRDKAVEEIKRLRAELEQARQKTGAFARAVHG